MSPTAILRAHDDAATLTSTAEQNDISVSCLECATGSSIVARCSIELDFVFGGVPTALDMTCRHLSTLVLAGEPSTLM